MNNDRTTSAPEVHTGLFMRGDLTSSGRKSLTTDASVLIHPEADLIKLVAYSVQEGAFC